MRVELVAAGVALVAAGAVRAADRTGAGTWLTNLRMHRAGVDRGVGTAGLGHRCWGGHFNLLGSIVRIADGIGDDPSIRSLDRGCACRMVMVMGRR